MIRDPVEDANTLLLGSEGAGARRRSCSARSPDRCPTTSRTSRATEPRGSAPRLPGGEVYTDDKAPVEWLIDKSILGYAGDR